MERQPSVFRPSRLSDWEEITQLAQPGAMSLDPRPTNSIAQQRSKRSVDEAGLDEDDDSHAIAVAGSFTSGEFLFLAEEEYPPAVIELFPELFPSIPSPRNRNSVEALSNPFEMESSQGVVRYEITRRTSSIKPTDGEVNGYVKFTFQSKRSSIPNFSVNSVSKTGPLSVGLGSHHRSSSSALIVTSNSIPVTPRNMGFRPQLDNLDRGLLDFYERAFCTGRTLLDTNAYLDIMTMTEADEGVRCCALALAASYLLDYVPENLSIRSRANSHYKRAVTLLTQRLSDPSVRVPGREDSVVGSLILLFSDDIVNWELRQVCDRNPRWRQGSRIARKILDASDPGHRYWDVHNVQSTQIRTSNANMVAYTEICALPVTPLEIEDHDRLFPWLLGGIERDVKRIHGGTGVSPKLLHTIAQITQLSAKLHKTPNSIALRLAAEEVERRLNTFRQWSELSEGFESAQELLDACVLDDQGLVNDAAMVTDLTGETWIQAAKIYLYCRFYRLPRNHAKVQESLQLLLQCLKCMPTKGKLFTAQSPFFCVFLAAMVTYQAPDRQIVQTWFEGVARASGTRSSVPPIWRVVQEYWTWVDEEPLPAHVDKIETTVPLGRRTAWWETIVDRFMKHEGQLSLV